MNTKSSNKPSYRAYLILSAARSVHRFYDSLSDADQLKTEVLQLSLRLAHLQRKLDKEIN